MHPHYLVLNDFTDCFGFDHKRGEVIVVGDATPPEVLDEIMVQIDAGNIAKVDQGAGVARPSDRESS